MAESNPRAEILQILRDMEAAAAITSDLTVCTHLLLYAARLRKALGLPDGD